MVLLSVVLVVVLVPIAIPNHDSSPRPNANESAAIATLKNICSAQSQVHTAVAIDCNADHRGEYATFAELAGAVPMRSHGGIDTGDILAFRAVYCTAVGHRRG